MSNLTVTVRDDTVRRARAKAAEQGTTLSALVGEFLEDYVGPDRSAGAIAAFLEIAAAAGASSGTGHRTWSRDDLYDRPGPR